MPWSTRKPTAIEIAPDWLKPYCEQFLQKLGDQGYAPATVRTYEGAARLLCEAVAHRGLRKGELADRTLSATHAAALKAMHPNKNNQKRYCLERFIDALVEAGVADRPKPKEKALTPLDRLQAEYEGYLRDQRGLTDATIYHCVRFLDRFMTFHFGDQVGDFNEITPHDVVEFIRKLRGGTARRAKTAPSHLRNLFRFLFWSGKTKRDLAASAMAARRAETTWEGLPERARQRGDGHIPTPSRNSAALSLRVGRHQGI